MGVARPVPAHVPKFGSRDDYFHGPVTQMNRQGIYFRRDPGYEVLYQMASARWLVGARWKFNVARKEATADPDMVIGGLGLEPRARIGGGADTAPQAVAVAAHAAHGGSEEAKGAGGGAASRRAPGPSPLGDADEDEDVRKKRVAAIRPSEQVTRPVIHNMSLVLLEQDWFFLSTCPAVGDDGRTGAGGGGGGDDDGAVDGEDDDEGGAEDEEEEAVADEASAGPGGEGGGDDGDGATTAGDSTVSSATHASAVAAVQQAAVLARETARSTAISEARYLARSLWRTCSCLMATSSPRSVPRNTLPYAPAPISLPKTMSAKRMPRSSAVRPVAERSSSSGDDDGAGGADGESGAPAAEAAGAAGGDAPAPDIAGPTHPMPREQENGDERKKCVKNLRLTLLRLRLDERYYLRSEKKRFDV
jgi:hypothetical protein